jgi:hypothetical protein
MTYELRTAVVNDHAFLWQMLYYAAYMNESCEPPPESARVNPDLLLYVEGLGRSGLRGDSD